MQSSRMRGGQAAIRTLEANGVQTVFGIPGVHTLELYDALVDSPIQHVLARHEQGAGFMADGYARASGKPGVALVITGPGVTNIATAAGEAFTDSIPMLILSSNLARPWLDQVAGHLHDLKDQMAVMRAVTKWNGRATEVRTIPEMINSAFTAMHHGRPRPTHVEIPLDVLAEFGDAVISPASPHTALGPSDSQVEAMINMITDAKIIILYCGGGAQNEAIGPIIQEIADRLGAGVLTSIMGKGSVSDAHPRVLGHIWQRGNAVDSLVASADLALVFGSKLGAQETDYQQMPMPSNLIRVDIDPQGIHRNYVPSLPIVADTTQTAIALLNALRARDVRKEGWSTDHLKKVRTEAISSLLGDEQQPYVDALRNAIPAGGILVNDMTMMSYVNYHRYSVYHPRTFLFPAGYGTLGYAVPAAIGAKLAQPERLVVAVVGDGGFQYTMQELATAVQYEISLPIVIFNDSTFTAVKYEQAEYHDRRFIAVDLQNPDFIKLADAYGVPGVTAASPDELMVAISNASKRNGPTIIDTPIKFTY